LARDPAPPQARRHCRAAEALASEFKAGAAAIESLCREVSEALLVDVERKRLYDLPEFEAVQAEHHARVRRARAGGRLRGSEQPRASAMPCWHFGSSGAHGLRPSSAWSSLLAHTCLPPLPHANPQAKAQLIDAHAGIEAALTSMHAPFASDGEDVQREWVRFTGRVDARLEDALRSTVKRSLQALSRLLNGDSKTEVLPLFRVTMVLERNARVELRPTIQQLFDTVHKVGARKSGASLSKPSEACGMWPSRAWRLPSLPAHTPAPLTLHSKPRPPSPNPQPQPPQVSRDLIAVLQHVPRVARPPTDRQRREAEERGEAAPPPPRPYYDVVAADEDATVRPIVTITTGITGVAEPVQVGARAWGGARLR
jgi:hypothetical protein